MSSGRKGGEKMQREMLQGYRDTSTRCPKLTGMNQGEMDCVTATALKIGYAVY